jgi:hypothetical protein
MALLLDVGCSSPRFWFVDINSSEHSERERDRGVITWVRLYRRVGGSIASACFLAQRDISQRAITDDGRNHGFSESGGETVLQLPNLVLIN